MSYNPLTTINSRISTVCKFTFYYTRVLYVISITGYMAKSVVISLVKSRLDYANSLLIVVYNSNKD